MNIVILGSGNIATHLGKAFLEDGHTILQVYSRNKANAQALATVLDADAVDSTAEITGDANLYVVAVTDRAITAVTADLPQNTNAIVAHCSGATSIDVLERFPLHGVIYPVQSLNKSVEASLQNIPFGIEGSDAKTATRLLLLIHDISPKSFLCDSGQRLALHTAAVFANNFSNMLFQVAYTILQEHGLSFDLLKPLILETAQKVQNQLPKDVQTGPAIRGDAETIQKHLKLLEKNPDWVILYKQLSEEITKQRPS